MTTQHTPGPWHVFRDQINDEVGLTVARWVQYVDEYKEHAEANARLIAAAPDMLAALVRVEASLTELGAKGEPLKSIRAAIAKATGGRS